MSETVIKYTRVDRNQEKIAKVAAVFLAHIDQWLKVRPSGQLEISIELNASQGGLGKVYWKKHEKGEV